MPDNPFAPVIPPNAARFVMPSLYVGLGGYAKAVLPRLDAHFNRHYGRRPDCLSLTIFDFDEAQAEVSGFSTQGYLRALPKKPLLDFARKIRGQHTPTHAFLQRFRPYVDLAHVHAVEAPGLNLFVQSGNLAWRLVWEHHVLPDLTSKLQQLHPAPNAQGQMERQGLVASPRSAIWVIAGGGSTTGPTGLIPMLCELKRLKPPQTNLFAVVFTPDAYRDKTTQHQVKGRAIFRATLTQLLAIYDGQEFDQPYGANGHRITLHEAPFDQLFLVDGSLMGGRSNLTTDELAELVALFLSQVAVGPVGERLLGLIGNLNPDANPDTQEAHHAD
jgi:hypothetical protein